MIDYDWKEKAAATVADDYAVEKAFMDQAYAAVQNKCGPLMSPPHQIGFEIVHKNDSATRMVGIFGFRAGRQLFYAPVFFLNGEIKGTDLLYRHLTKSFVPLDEEWVVFLISNARSEIGNGISKDESRQLPVRLDLETLANPPMTGGSGGRGSFKYASEDDEPADFSKEALAKQWEDVFDAIEELPNIMAKSASKGELLKKLILASGPAKGSDVVAKIASAMEESIEFHTEMLRNFDEGNYFPEELITMRAKAASDAREKAAAEKGEEVTVLSIRREGEAHPSMFKHGFVIDDKREKSQLSVAYVDDNQRISSSVEPGVWDVLQPNGSFEEMMVFYDADTYDVGVSVANSADPPTICHPEDCSGGSYHYEDPRLRRMVLVRSEGNNASGTERSCDVHGNEVKSVGELMKSDKLKEKLETGKAYRAINPDNMEASRPFVVTKKKERDGVVEYRIRTGGWSKDERVIVVNPDSSKNSIEDGMFNGDARFVQVGLKKFVRNTSEHGPDFDLDFHTDIVCGNEDAVDAWIRSHTPTKEASIQEDPYDGRYTVSYSGQTRRGLSKVAAVAALTVDLQLPGDTALELLEKVAEEDANRLDFIVWPKEAAQLQLRSQPQFQIFMDSDFGMPVDPYQAHILETMWNGPEVPQNRIGDAWDPAMGSGRQNEDGIGDDALLNMDPQQIAQMAQGGETPTIFEHGVIGTLTNVFDANALVKEYLPKLEDAVDALGRTLFLFYWKPTDFEMTYGADDMSQMENQISSNFKSLGTLLLELLKRSKISPEKNQSGGR